MSLPVYRLRFGAILSGKTGRFVFGCLTVILFGFCALVRFHPVSIVLTVAIVVAIAIIAWRSYEVEIDADAEQVRVFERVRNRPRTLLLELEQRHIERFVLTVKRVEHVDEAYDTLQYGFVMKDGSVKLVGGVSSNTLDLEIIDRINEQLGVEHGESMYRLPTCVIEPLKPNPPSSTR
jgi:hypothetical protein